MRSWCSWKAPENGRQGVRMRRKCTLRGPGIAHGQKLLSWVPGLSIIESSCSVSTHFLLSVFFHLSISLSLSLSLFVCVCLCVFEIGSHIAQAGPYVDKDGTLLP